MSESSKAVFLSYASQDAEAAQRICEALRAAGVEVWFDQNELVGGDAWDAKIRGQIAGCALFVPVISANTQARLEGYFRLEWKLAAQRTHTMADEKVFLLPIVIDDTRDAEAKVPAEFRAVQWTRLRPMGFGAASPPGGSGAASPAEGEGKALAAFGARVGELLGGEAAGAGAEVGARLDRAREDGRGRVTPLRKSAQARWWTMLAAAVVAVGGMGAWWFSKTQSEATPARQPAVVTKPVSEAAELVAQAWAQLDKPDMGRAELDAAEALLQKATTLEPNNADAWAAWSVANTWFVFHNWDRSPRRIEAARVYAERAVRLDARSFNTRYARALFLVRVQGSNADAVDLARPAAGLLRELLRERPDDPRVLYTLGFLLVHEEATQGEGFALLERAAQHPGFAAMAWDEYGWMKFFWGRFAEAEKAAERSLAALPYWNNLGLEVTLASRVRDDLDAAKRALERMPTSARQEDMALGMSWQIYLWRKEPTKAVAAMESESREWIRYFFSDTPRTYLLGLARLEAGQAQAGNRDLQRALELLAPRLAETPNDVGLLSTKAHALLAMGEKTEGEKVYRLVRELWPETHLALLFEPPEAALAYVQAVIEQPFRSTTWRAFFTAPALRRDLWFERVRSAPGFAALLRRAEEIERGLRGERGTAAVAAEGKSVAVLAFKNLSDDRDTEYFSDGVSEELGNVLGRVPGLRVAASTSAFSFKGKAVPVAEIARQLGVAYVVEGSVRKMGTTLRINAKLVQASDGFPVWSSGNLEREVKNIFALQDEIAGMIAQALALKLNVRSGVSTPVNPEAYRLYLEGRAAWRLRTPAGEAKAEALLQQALALDPDFARGHVGLADVWVVRAQRENSAGQLRRRNRPLMERALASAQRAVQADSGLPEVHTVLGTIQWMDWKLDEAVRSHRIAVGLNPNDASAQQRLGRALLTAGDMEEALGALQRAHELDPLFARIADNYSLALIAARRFDAAVAMADRALALQPELRQALSYKVVALSELGRRNEVMASAREFLDEDRPIEQDSTPAMVAYGLARVNATAEAERLLARLPEEKRQAPVAAALLAMGKRQEALSVLRAGNSNVTVSDVLLWWPVFDAVRESAEFKEIISEMGLTEAHARAQAWRAANPPEKPAAKR